MTGELLGNLASTLILLSGVAMLVGVALIRRKDRVWHPRVMVVATALAALFLVFYLLKWGLFGTTAYAGPDEWRIPYYTLLVVHTILATLNGPLVIYLLYTATQGKFHLHRPWARLTVPIWLFVAVSGWVINYILMYYGETAGEIRF